MVSCIGYTGETIDPTVKYDASLGCIPNKEGRIISSEGKVIPSKKIWWRSLWNKDLYCNGWIKTGPRGNIATTMTDSMKTGQVVMADYEEFSKGYLSLELND